MSGPFRRIVATILFLASLFLEWMVIVPLVPWMSNEDISKFMTISMGLAFIPFFIALIVAAIGLAILVGLALLPARLFLSATRPG